MSDRVEKKGEEAVPKPLESIALGLHTLRAPKNVNRKAQNSHPIESVSWELRLYVKTVKTTRKTVLIRGASPSVVRLSNNIVDTAEREIIASTRDKQSC